MKRRVLLMVGSAFVLLLSSVSSAGVAHAATAQNGNGNALRISPVRNDLTIQPGEKKSESVTIQNITSNPISIRGIINDFGPSSDESGQPRVYLDEGSSAPSRGLKNYVSGLGTYTLQPNESKAVNYTISMPSNAVGGYFGAVRFVPATNPDGGNLSLTASVASLVLVTVPGNLVEQLGIDSLNVSKPNGKATNFVVDGDGLQADVRFKNSGNIQEAPFGKVALKKSGKILANYEVNNTDPRGEVLPDSIRKFSVSFGDKATGFGHYSVEANFGYGTKGQLMIAKTSFWVVPVPYLVAGIVLLVIVLAAIIIFPRMLRSHDRKLLKRVRGRGKK